MAETSLAVARSELGSGDASLKREYDVEKTIMRLFEAANRA